MRQNDNELSRFIIDAKTNLDNLFSDDSVNNIQTEEIKNVLKRYINSDIIPIGDRISQLSEIINSPIHVGMLGRYSHGKSALVNALFDLSNESKLPEGDGVVTSKVTYVCFDKDLFESEAYEVNKDGTENFIDLRELQNSVGQTMKDTSNINYFKLCLCPENKAFAHNFAERNINLVDMPGLGGPYFKDQAETRQYVSNLDMIIVVIKIDEIRESGLHVENFVEKCGVSVIPVLTFFDKWEESKLYSECKDVDEMLMKAKKEIENYIPSLRPYFGNLIAVSSFDGHNIDQLRNLIMSQIQARKIAIAKSRTEISPVYRRHLRVLQKAFSELKSDLENAMLNLESLLKPILDKNADKIDIISGAFKADSVKWQKKLLNSQVKTIVNDIFNKYRGKVNLLQSAGKMEDLDLGKFVDGVNCWLGHECELGLDSPYLDFKNRLQSEIYKLIDGMMIDFKSKVGLKNKVKCVMDDNRISCDEMRFEISQDNQEIYKKIKEGYHLQVTANFFKVMWKDTTSKILILVGLVLMLFGVGVLVIIAAFVIFSIKHTSENKEAFEDAKRKVIKQLKDEFNCEKYGGEMMRIIEEKSGCIKDQLNSELGIITNPYNSDARYLSQVKENVQEIIDGISNKLEDELCKIAQEKR